MKTMAKHFSKICTGNVYINLKRHDGIFEKVKIWHKLLLRKSKLTPLKNTDNSQIHSDSSSSLKSVFFFTTILQLH